MNKNHLIKSIMSIILAAAVLLPSDFSYCEYASAEEKELVTYGESVSEINDTDDTNGGGVRDIGIHVPLADDDSENSSISPQRSSRIPEKYDPRSEEWFSIIPVKNQSDTGLCWAFAASTAAEISYAYSQSDQTDTVQLSPVHLGYFFYNRVNDPLGNTKYDKNIMISDDYEGITDYTDAGGNNYLTFQALAGWTGMAAESLTPFEQWLGKTLDSKLAYRNSAVIRNADLIRSNTAAKTAIMENGSVLAGVYMREFSYYDPETYGYNCTAGLSSNHVVTIIGWDDSYSKDNFRSGRQPQNDGAWIVQNSYGTDWGDKGYFYISYEDASLENVMTMEMQSAGNYEYNFQYDGNAAPGGWPLSPGEKAAEVFTVPRDGRSHFLEAAGFTSYSRDISGNGDEDSSYMECDVAVYTNLKNAASPVSGTKKCSFTTSVGKTGFHTVELPERIYLEPGSRYSVVVTVKENVNFGAEHSTDDDVYGWIKFQCGLSRGQSFWYGASKSGAKSVWHDSYDQDFCTRIKGFTNTAPSMTARPSSFKAALYGHDDIKLTWSRVSGADGYRITYRKQGDAYYRTLCHTTGTSVKKGNLTDGKKYYFRVEPYRKENGVRYYSSGYRSCSIYTLKKVTGVKVSKVSGSQVKVKWSKVTGASGYQTARSASSNFKSFKTKNVSSRYTYAKINSAKYKTYYYKVRAYRNENGKKICGPWSSAVKYKLR